jgi:hypothetical protein
MDRPLAATSFCTPHPPKATQRTPTTFPFLHLTFANLNLWKPLTHKYQKMLTYVRTVYLGSKK